MVLGRKTNFFLKKPQKKIVSETMRPDSKRMVFLVFPRKKMVLGRKTNFFLGKTKKTIFLESGRIVYRFWFFLGKSWFSCRKLCPKPCFS